ncbi:DUF523 domain-containing protein [Dethiothermospora halolimnae]|uniref:DUF523 domain-containing protein n=1 Tax=Dethiothermospora halolimnae TaxID=3114390 RepID=UPI003CCC1586
MDTILKDKVNVGISGCMYGGHLRYNKKGFDVTSYFGRDKNSFIFHPVCPECMAGLGVPRSTIRLVGGNGFDVLDGNGKVIQRGGEDVTDKVIAGSKACIDTLKRGNVDIFIFMEGSPSCGVNRTTLKNKRLGNPPGVFGAMLEREDFFLIKAQDVQSPIRRWDIRRRIHAYKWTKNVQIDSKNDLFEFWHIMKFLCQEINRKKADEIGRMLAGLPKGFDRDKTEEIRNKVIDLLKVPSTVAKIKQMLWKNYCHFKKKYDMEVDMINMPTEYRGMNKIVEELTELEKRAYLEDKLFGSTPILYRGR